MTQSEFHHFLANRLDRFYWPLVLHWVPRASPPGKGSGSQRGSAPGLEDLTWRDDTTWRHDVTTWPRDSPGLRLGGPTNGGTQKTWTNNIYQKTLQLLKRNCGKFIHLVFRTLMNSKQKNANARQPVHSQDSTAMQSLWLKILTIEASGNRIQMPMKGVDQSHMETKDANSHTLKTSGAKVCQSSLKVPVPSCTVPSFTVFVKWEQWSESFNFRRFDSSRLR